MIFLAKMIGRDLDTFHQVSYDGCQNVRGVTYGEKKQELARSMTKIIRQNLDIFHRVFYNVVKIIKEVLAMTQTSTLSQLAAYTALTPVRENIPPPPPPRIYFIIY
jgi:hypothetical protein